MSDIKQLELMYKNELEERKSNIRKATESVVAGLIKIGFELKKIRDRQLYIYEGYKDFNEFVLKEFKMERTAASKIMKLNDTYSEGGYSEQIKEHLEEKLNGLGKSLLIEMTSLPEEDYELVTPGMGVKDIRPLINAENELKEEEKKANEQVPGQTSLIDNFSETVPDSEKAQKEHLTISNVIREMFRPRDMKERLDTLVNMDPDSADMEWWIDDLTRSRKVFNRLPFFLFFHEKEIKIKNVPEKTIETKTYKEFYFMVRAAFGKEVVRGTDVWYQAFGEEWEQEEKQREEEERRKEEEQEKIRKKKESETKKGKEQKTKPQNVKNVDFPQREAVSEKTEKEPETTEIHCNEPEIVTGEVENPSNEDENKVCDIAQNLENPQCDSDSVWCKESETESEEDEEWHYIQNEQVSNTQFDEILSGMRRHFVTKTEFRKGTKIKFITQEDKREINARITVVDVIMGSAYNACGFKVIDDEE